MIEVERLSKKYGPFEAVRDVSFSVGPNQALGFLGPNGAGKTTIMRILAGCHFPSGGQARIDGISVEENPVEIKKRIGYLPENVPLYGDMTPEEYLRFAAAARLLPKKERGEAVARAIAACGLEGYETRRIESLSKGYRQRVGLAQAIIHDPPVLILDEPTSGLDPNQIIEMRALIRELGTRKTVILSTHILQEVEAVCSRALILNEGRIAAQGTPEEIAATAKGKAGASAKGGDIWELLLKGAFAADLENRLAGLGGKAGELRVETLEGGIIRLAFSLDSDSGGDGPDCSAEGELIFDWAVSQGYKIIGMSRKKQSLEDIFARLTAGEGEGR